MRKTIIALGTIFVLFIIIFVLAVLNLNFFINSNKDLLVSQIEQSLGRKITVGEINTGFSDGLGIRLKNASVGDDKSFSDSEFISASDIQINVEIIPLLSKKINITKLILNRPLINIIKNKGGKYNFESIGSDLKSNKKENKSDTSNKASGPPLFASSIVIKQGQINYLDEKSETEFQIQKTNLGIKDLGFDKKVLVNLEAAILASEPNIKIGGIFGPVTSELSFSKMPAKGNLEITELDINTLKKFLPIIKEYIPPGLDISGPLNAKLKFSGALDSITLTNIKMNASVFGATVPNFELSGSIGPIGENRKNFSLDTQFSLQNANLSKLRNFSLIKDSLDNSLSTQGTLDFSGKISGTPENLEFSAVRLDATASRLAVIGKFLKPKNAPFVITGGGKISNSVIELKSSEIKLDTLKLNASGKIHRGTTNLINLLVRSNKIDLANMRETFPSIKEYNPSGRVELLQTNLTGELGKGQVPQINGSLLLTDVTIYPPSFPKPISNINTKVNFTGKSANIKDMSLNLGKSNLNISSKIDNFSPLVLSYTVTSAELHLSDISKEKSQTDKSEVIKQLVCEGKVSKKFDSMTVKGNLSSSEAKLSDYELQDIKTNFNLIGETLKIEDFSLKAYEGVLKGKASYSLGQDSDFSIISNVRGLNLNNFLSSLNSEDAEKIQGKANLDINIFGSGDNWNEIKTSLKGTAKTEIIDGAVLDVNLTDDVLKGVTGVPGLSFLISPDTKDKYPQIFTAQDTEFDEFKSSFIIENGKMETRDLKISSKDYSIKAKGWMNLDGKLDLKSRLLLSPEFSKDLRTDMPDLKYITNSNNQVEIPFAITGTLPKAKAKPDIPYLAKLVQKAGIRSVIDELTSDPDEHQEQNEEIETQPSPKKKKKRLDKKIFDDIKDLF